MLLGLEALIDGFVNAIYLYDDHAKLILNYKNDTKTITLDELQGSDFNSVTAPRKKARLARVFCVTWGEGEKSGIPRRSRAEAAKHGAEKRQKPFPPTKPSRAQPADNPLLCAKRCA